MADLCADGPAPVRGRAALQAGRGLGARHAGPRGRQAQGLRLLARSSASAARPCVLIGLASIKRTSKRDTVLRAIMTDQFRRAVLAFPDEDVLVGTRFTNAGGFEAFKSLDDIVPRPDHKATGEERAWGRRLAKRFGIENGGYDDRAFIATGDGVVPAGPRPREPQAREPRRRGRRRSSTTSTPAGATRSSPSAGRWPRTSPSSADHRPVQLADADPPPADGAVLPRSSPLPPGTLDHILELGLHAPVGRATARAGPSWCSKGRARPAATGTSTLPVERRDGFPWPGLLVAPALIVPLAHAQTYVDRYAEADKASTGLGGSADDWPVPVLAGRHGHGVDAHAARRGRRRAGRAASSASSTTRPR